MAHAAEAVCPRYCARVGGLPVASKTSGKLIGALVLTGALSIGGVYAYKAAQPREGKVRGTIAAVNLPARTAVLDVIHPKTGVLFQLSGNVREDCKIELEGAATTFDQTVAL